jgi:lysophospholipase L1-like esterase
VLGDSYTEGVGSSGPGYVDLVGERMGWTVVEQGQGGTGYVSAGSTPGFAPYGARVAAVVAEAPDIVVVQGSTNDVGQPATAVHDAAVGVLTALREQLPAARVVVVGPLAPPVVDPAGVVAIRDALADAAARADVDFIDPIAGGWLQPPTDLYPDGLHPGDEGYRLMAARLSGALEERGF